MPWNYRVMSRNYAVPGSNEPETVFEIHEVYFDLDKETSEETRLSPTVDPITPGSDSLEGLRWELEHMLAALDRPVLAYEEDAVSG
jgi:hypothetical protein